MSGDRKASSSFGDPNAQQPPTPKQTPTSAVFPSPIFDTPKEQQAAAALSDSGSWTPRFAEEFSVFNTTPGNLRGSEGPFADFGSSWSAQSYSASVSTAHKRQLSLEGFAVEIATHTNHFSSNPDQPLPPVDPSHRLQSSPAQASGSLHQRLEDDRAFSEADTERENSSPPRSTLLATPSATRSAKKAKKENSASLGAASITESQGGQTATPPPSSQKNGRKSAPKPNKLNTTMQNDDGFGHADFATDQQTAMAGFSANDMFGYPMTAPAAAPSNFWDPAADMSAMDLDFTSFGSDVFQTPMPAAQGHHGHHRHMNSFDASQMFQDPSAPAPMPQQQHHQLQAQLQMQQPHHQTQDINQGKPRATRKERPLAPKVSPLPSQGNPTTTAAMTTSMTTASFPATTDDPFGLASPNGGGVDPGLLFSRPQSSSMDASFSMTVPQGDAAAAIQQQQQQQQQQQFSMSQVARALSSAPMRGDFRRSHSTRELAPSKLPDRASASSPIKSNGRPGLQRSFSENRGKRGLARAKLPPLAPAARPEAPGPGSAGSTSGSGPGPSSRQSGARPSGRISPLKNHHRLSSLTSIPETAPARTRTSVKFTIDAAGRARAETTVIVDDPETNTIQRRRPSSREAVAVTQLERSYESDDDDSSTDDEPIIIPSRNTSFALPDPHKPTLSGYHTAQRSISERSNSSFATGISGEAPGHDIESEAETVVHDSQRGGRSTSSGGVGDAASELRKVVESRQQKMAQPGSTGPRGRAPQRYAPGSFGNFPRHNPSPSALTDRSFFTPSTHSKGPELRCVCHRNEMDGDAGSEGFLVQCESCEMWLHGACINIPSKRAMPSVYICAFCANTPNMRGGRMRDTGRGAGTSPLAHKSFKSFR